MTLSQASYTQTRWSVNATPTKTPTVRHMKYPEFQTGIFVRMKSAQGFHKSGHNYWGIIFVEDLSLQPIAPIWSLGKVLGASSELQAFSRRYLPIIKKYISVHIFEPNEG